MAQDLAVAWLKDTIRMGEKNPDGDCPNRRWHGRVDDVLSSRKPKIDDSAVFWPVRNTSPS